MRFKAGYHLTMRILEGEKATLRLDADQALVLFELLTRWADSALPGLLQHPGEQTVLWAIESQLEKQLVVAFDPGYVEALATARQRLAGE